VKTFFSIFIGFFVFVIIFGSGFLLGQATPTAKNIVAKEHIDPDQVLRLINVFRISNELQPLVKSDYVCTLTSERALYIHQNLSEAISGYRPDIAHQGLDIIQKEYTGHLISDLWLSKPFNEEEMAMRWIFSKTHRDHILYPSYSQACVYIDSDIAILMVAQP